MPNYKSFVPKTFINESALKLPAILLIENHPLILSACQQWLGTLELYVVIAKNVSNAFQHVHFFPANYFELILLDWELSEEENPGLNNPIRSNSNKNDIYIPVLVLISSASARKKINALYHKLSPPAFLSLIKSWIQKSYNQFFKEKEAQFISCLDQERGSQPART